MKLLLVVLAASATLTAPAAAGAARVGHEPDGRIVYRAAENEVNAVDVRRDATGAYPFAQTLLYTESAALLMPGVACLPGTPVACQARDDAAIYLGNRNDRAAQRVGDFARSYVYGEAGDDDIFSGGGQAYAEGGGGDDRITVAADGSRWRIDGGTGHDAITVTGEGVDNVVCGPGWDLANVGPEDTVAPD